VFLPRADRLYLTLIDSEIAGDSYFPEYQQLNWRETERRQHDRDEKNKYNFSFVTLERHI
jgi:dihydrofolate reductase